MLDTTSNAATISAALRAYLRWRASCGDAVQPLLAVICVARALEPGVAAARAQARARSIGC